jgi:hypothetical protein
LLSLKLKTNALQAFENLFSVSIGLLIIDGDGEAPSLATSSLLLFDKFLKIKLKLNKKINFN